VRRSTGPNSVARPTEDRAESADPAPADRQNLPETNRALPGRRLDPARASSA